MVVIIAFLMPKLRLTQSVTGAKQLVVQEALEIILSLFFIFSSFTPITNVFISFPFGGADMITFFAPAKRCAEAASLVRKKPVDSITTSTFKSFHGNFSEPGRRLRRIFWPVQ